MMVATGAETFFGLTWPSFWIKAEQDSGPAGYEHQQR
jgi:hypothetical protein